MFLSRWFQIESLYKFNAKFCPVWEPRFFVYPGGRDAPRMAIAALEAEAFLVWPRLEVRRHARQLGRRIIRPEGQPPDGRPPSYRAEPGDTSRGDDPPYPTVVSRGTTPVPPRRAAA